MQNFTNKYQLSKTLRFELKPVGKDGNRLNQEEAEKLFEKIIEQDRKIKTAYLALKPILDKIHEDIINDSLISEIAKEIDFSLYFEEYKKGKAKKLDSFEKSLRESIGVTFEKTANDFANSAGNDEKGKPIFKKKKDKDVGVNYLTQAGILNYIENKIKDLVDENEVKAFIDKKEEITKSIDKKGKTKEKKEIKRTGHLAVMSGFFGYFDGYNLNRENYYVIDSEKSTAVATRVVHENLPKFCDNAILFEKRKEEYLNALQYLKENNKSTQIKDAETNKYIDAESIAKDWFEIQKFPNCLTQIGIDEYNKKIGHFNLLINLYNQAKKEEIKDFKKLPEFNTLYKQIGSVINKSSLFYALKYDTIQEQEDAQVEATKPLSQQGIIEQIGAIGEKYFSKPKNINSEDITIHSFTNWLKENEEWEGVYWSKAALDIISTKYLINWHSIKDRIAIVLQSKNKDDAEFKKELAAVATFKKNREEELKINDAVELSGLFRILNENYEAGWSETFFKTTVLEDRKDIIDEKKTPSQNLINLICADMENLALEFCDGSAEILKIAEEYTLKNEKKDESIGYQKEENILAVKNWLDKAKFLIWAIKHFEVKPSKIKGNNINSDLSNMLNALLHAEDTEWFDWYDAVRNYLTRKPQDDAKKNKLKLNFENSSLLKGWSDGQEKTKGSVILRNGEKQYVGILIQRNLFDTENENNSIYDSNNSNAGRLILRNIKFQTVAGKGFGVGENSYGNLGKANPIKAVKELQQFIKERYIKKYPLLETVANKRYSDKKVFDKEIQDVLAECYECEFVSIDWSMVLKYVEEGKIFLFEIYTKDFSQTKGVKSANSNVNLQTKYWQHLFDDNSTIQLNGGGEIFYRKEVELNKSDKAIHPANEKIQRRSDKKTESVFKHDIIKNKRFTENKFLFHVPIKINYQAPSKSNVNDTVNTEFTKSDDIQFLGIDRGEKHLIYFSLLDKNGNLINQGHFDLINNKDYLAAINEAAKLRREKQENWQQKGNISNLKEGYISLVIHEIIQKMKDDNGAFKPTFIVLEDLNTGFKRSRQKFEQQIYQKFEVALAKKLNYLVDKKANPGEIGSVSKALQLTPLVSNYGDIEKKKQAGIILYTRANYTSVTDPATGWRKTIYLKKGKESEIKEEILNTFTEIAFDNGDYYFQYNDALGKEWKLWSGKNGVSLERYQGRRGKDKNEYVVESFDVKALLDGLFKGFDLSKSLKEQLIAGKSLSKVNDHTAWDSLRFVIDIIQQIRNSGDVNKKQDDNFLQSPVRNEQAEHFDSRNYEKQENPKLPKDADANGAFNIARKGIIMYEHIKHWVINGKKEVKIDGNDVSDLDLFISDNEWDLWLANQNDWKKDLGYFASRIEKEDKPEAKSKKSKNKIIHQQ